MHDIPRWVAQGGHEVLDLTRASFAEAFRAAEAAIAHGRVDALVVCGGDGMAAMGTAVCVGTGIPLLICPAGTGNDNARALGLPLGDPAAAVDVLRTGRLRTVDVGRRFVDDVPASEGVWLGVLGAGFDSVVNERANSWTWPRGRVRYNLAILRELPVFRAIPYRITVDDEEVDTDAMLVAVGNGPAFGGGMRVCPDAVMDDGLLDVTILHNISTPEFLRVFPTVFSGRHVTHPAVQILRGRRVRLEARGIVAYADGERFARLPLDLGVDVGALTVVVPA